MFELKGYKGFKKVLWQNLEPGMVYVGGIHLSHGGIEELSSYTVLTKELLSKLFTKYHFLKNKTVIVAESAENSSPFQLIDQLKEKEIRLNKLNAFRREYLESKQILIQKHSLAIEPQTNLVNTNVVEQDFLIKDRYNSFSISTENEEIPSIVSRINAKVTFADLISGKLKEKFNLPDDKNVVLHIVVDYSYSMDTFQKLDFVISAVHSFYKHISEFFLNTEIKLYAFSNECVPISFPLSGREISREETYYSTFIKKVLHHKNSEKYNKVILFTDGQPKDYESALELGQKLKRNKIDFTQLVFFINDDIRYEYIDEIPKHLRKDGYAPPENLPSNLRYKTLDEEELKIKKKAHLDRFTQFAEACGGNQIIVSVYDFTNLISVECYDRYVGLLTLANPEEIQQIQTETFQEATQKVKKFDFKRL